MIANEYYYFSLCQYVVFLKVYYDLVCVNERDASTSRGIKGVSLYKINKDGTAERKSLDINSTPTSMPCS